MIYLQNFAKKICNPSNRLFQTFQPKNLDQTFFVQELSHTRVRLKVESNQPDLRLIDVAIAVKLLIIRVTVTLLNFIRGILVVKQTCLFYKVMSKWHVYLFNREQLSAGAVLEMAFFKYFGFILQHRICFIVSNFPSLENFL